LNPRRQLLIALSLSALAVPLGSHAQQGKVWRIGYLDFGSQQFAAESRRYTTFIEAMRELGYVEGKNFVVKARFADGRSDRLSTLATELARSKVDVILSTSTPATHAAQRATSTIPIVAPVLADPVAEGFAASLARPGGNVTGLSLVNVEIVQKHFELLMKVLPRLRRVAALSNSANAGHPQQLKNVQVAAQQAGREVLPVAVGTQEEIKGAFATMAREHAQAVIIFGDTIFVQQARQIAELARKQQIASIFTAPDYAEAGGLMSYGPDVRDHFHRAATFVDKIFKGAKAGELPFEQPTRFYLTINRKTAKAIGIAIPQELLLRADKVIE
jgi:ABC-type uncharacterized transport system substrate-binding protein